MLLKFGAKIALTGCRNIYQCWLYAVYVGYTAYLGYTVYVGNTVYVSYAFYIGYRAIRYSSNVGVGKEAFAKNVCHEFVT